MSTYTRLPASSTPRAGPARSNHFIHAGPYAPRRRTRSLPVKSLVAWENEGGSLADPPSV
jgi:hypothetical protein